MKILELSATELAKKIKAGEITSEEAAKASLAQIAKEGLSTGKGSGRWNPLRKIHRPVGRCPDCSER